MDTQAGRLETSVRLAVDALKPDGRDAAAVVLAATYAREVDNGGDLEKLGPLLLSVLEALQMTPRARAAAMKGGTGDRQPTSPLDELRARRARRDRAPAVDSSTS